MIEFNVMQFIWSVLCGRRNAAPDLLDTLD